MIRSHPLSRSRWSSSVRNAPVTWAVVVACVGMHGWTLERAVRIGGWEAISWLWGSTEVAGGLGAVGGLVAGRVWVDGEWWRVLTTGFVHGSVLHLALNMWSLWIVGPWAERTLGRGWTLGSFLGSSVLGVLASLAWAEASIVVGASAGILGVAGGLVVARAVASPSERASLKNLDARGLTFALVLVLVLGSVVPMIAQAGHVGGLMGGALFGGLRAQQRAIRWTCGLGLAAGALAVAAAAASPSARPGFHTAVGFRLLEQKEDARALEHFEKALRLDAESHTLANAVAYGLAVEGRQLDRALELVGLALRQEPDQADYLDTLGWVHCRAGRVREGEVALRRAEVAAEGKIPEIGAHLRDCGQVLAP